MTTPIEPDHLSLECWLEHRHDFDLYAAIEDAATAAPATFAELVQRLVEYDLTLEDFADRVAHVWVRDGDTHLSRDVWRTLFDAAGYRVDDVPAARPTRPLMLFRGATPECRANWSWTERHDTAHLYASGSWVQDEVGLVWRAVVEPERLLACFTAGRYSEYIVDTDGLKIDPHSLWCRCPVDLAPFRGDDSRARLALDLHELVDCARSLPPDHL